MIVTLTPVVEYFNEIEDISSGQSLGFVGMLSGRFFLPN
jgi:hypothetical protein